MTESQASEDPKSPTRIYMFKSTGKSKLRAFAGDSGGSKLPQQHGPWHAIGVIRPDKDPPHNFSRADIDEAIEDQGYQLWRIKAPAAAGD
jgi:hypothetical protein